VLEKVFSNHAGKLSDVGRAMINVTLKPSEKKILEVRDIVAIANQ
jgi:hypothetical protein